MDPGRAPLRVFLADPLNEIAQATIDLWPPCPTSRFPASESFEASAMPSQNGLRLNHLGHAKQARPEPCYPYQQRTINPAQSKAGRRMPQCDGKLMAEKFSASGRLRNLNRSATNTPSACGIANIAINDAMILPYHANLDRLEFPEKTGDQRQQGSRRIDQSRQAAGERRFQWLRPRLHRHADRGAQPAQTADAERSDVEADRDRPEQPHPL